MELLYGAALQQRQQGGPQPQGGLFPGKTHMGNDSSHGQQQDHPHQTQQQQPSTVPPWLQQFGVSSEQGF